MADSPHFHASPTDAGTELRLMRGHTAVPVAGWALIGHSGVDLCNRLILGNAAIDGDDMVLVEHAAIARLTAAEAARLDLPPVTALRAVIEGTGVILRPGFVASLRWTRPGGQNALGVTRVGAWLQQAEGWRRLPETLFTVAQAVDAYAQAAQADDADRLRALAALREALPPAATAGTAEGSGLLGAVTILEADALSLETMGDGDALQLVPVLHRAGDGAEPLLPEDRQQDFGRNQFHRWPTARSVYTLSKGMFVVISPPLRQAMEVVRKAAAGSPAQRRAFLREPRGAIRAAIGDEVDAALVDSLVIETPTWSERVLGLGLWQPRVLPWIAIPPSDWFGAGTTEPPAPRPLGLTIGGTCLPLSPDEATALRVQIVAAMAAGRPHVTVPTDDGPVQVPADDATLNALAKLRTQRGGDTVPPPAPATSLLIKPNETARDIEAMATARARPAADMPSALRTALMHHQAVGLRWLQDNWTAGSPGVLLADDMGLGKTLQGLAFLAWLRDGMAAGAIPRAPLLIVAPTGLLENWRAEHDRHLTAPGLGEVVPAYGRGLAALRRPTAAGAASLDLDALRNACWVLTTYETLRDQSTEFGQVRFAAMLLDEAQKVKTPGIRLTDAAKGMNADFRIAMTGTPVENRLADLWCIVDGVAAGHLNDLKWFSATFEANPTVEKLRELKASLDVAQGRRPPLLLRRLKQHSLRDLPSCEQIVLKAEMQGRQLAAYDAAVQLGRGDQGAGRVLEALQRLRAASLGIAGDPEDDDAAVISGSARLRLVMDCLDGIHTRGERALLFLDDLSLMARLAGLLQRRYALRNIPMTISGKLSGSGRQARVDRFQAGGAGFDVMLLSPRAGGVGLTLTAANHVIHLARWWNPAVEDQCNGRALRIGQTRPVTVYLPLAVLPGGRPSFDQNLHDLLERKRRLMHDALVPPECRPDELAGVLQATLG